MNSLAGPSPQIASMEGRVAALSQNLSESEAARQEAEEAALELVKDLAALRGQYETFRQEKRAAASLQLENDRLTRCLTWRSALAVVQVALFVYFAIAVAGKLGMCGFSNPT
jgi:DNA repair exonuclease SbcCD ATPase subunit